MAKVTLEIEDIPNETHFVTIKYIKEPQDPMSKETYAERVGFEICEALRSITREEGGRGVYPGLIQ